MLKPFYLQLFLTNLGRTSAWLEGNLSTTLPTQSPKPPPPVGAGVQSLLVTPVLTLSFGHVTLGKKN